MTREADTTSAKRALHEGARLAQEAGTALGVSLDNVREAAGISVEEFARHFPDERKFQLALLLHFLDLARAEAIEALSRAAPGIARVKAAFECYWDSNLRCRPMRELAIHFRADPEGAEILKLRLTGVIVIAQHELRSIGWPHPAATARLAGTMCVEAAVAEYEAKGKLPDMREAVLAYFREPRPTSAGGRALP